MPVSGPFHCELMSKATLIMKSELEKIKIKHGKNILISNVTANPIQEINEIRDLLIKQIENRVKMERKCLLYDKKGSKPIY